MGAVCPRRVERCLPVFREWRVRVNGALAEGFVIDEDGVGVGVNGGAEDVDARRRS